jgi:hypothetical protein
MQDLPATRNMQICAALPDVELTERKVMLEKKQKSDSPEKGKSKDLSNISLFELSIISVMPNDVYHEIKKRIELALAYLEDGAVNTAKDILRTFQISKGGKL